MAALGRDIADDRIDIEHSEVILMKELGEFPNTDMSDQNGRKDRVLAENEVICRHNNNSAHNEVQADKATAEVPKLQYKHTSQHMTRFRARVQGSRGVLGSWSWHEGGYGPRRWRC